jgi:uncharacterized membrane protein YdbT with pleckstrin-like domain
MNTEQPPIILRPAWRREWFTLLVAIFGLWFSLNPAAFPFVDSLQSLMLKWGLPVYLLPLVQIFAVMVAIAYFIITLWYHYQWRFFIGPQGVESMLGIIGRDERRAEYKNITFVRLQQSFFQRLFLFGIGDILIGTSATSEPELVFYGIHKARHFKGIIQARIREFNQER